MTANRAVRPLLGLALAVAAGVVAESFTARQLAAGLLAVLYGWYDWPRRSARAALAAAGLAATATMAATRSASAIAATLACLVLLTPLSRVREAKWRDRFAWAAATAVMLLPLVQIAAGDTAAPTRLSTPAEPILLNGAPSTLVVPLVIAAVWATGAAVRGDVGA